MGLIQVTRNNGEFFIAGVMSACGLSWDSADIVRFFAKCRIERHIDGEGRLHRCVVFTGATSSGGASYDKKYQKKRGPGRKQYGSFYTKGKTVRAHKFYAVAVLGLRPGPGDELDHTCYNTRCVSCLECVPRQVNQDRIRRGKRDAQGQHTTGTSESPDSPVWDIGEFGPPIHPDCRCHATEDGEQRPAGHLPSLPAPHQTD